jgi:hypothetical protein
MKTKRRGVAKALCGQAGGHCLISVAVDTAVYGVG